MRRSLVATLTVALTAGLGLPLLPAQASTTGTVSGVVFQDDDRDGRVDADEAGFASLDFDVVDAAGRSFGTVRTGPDGRFSVAGVADGSYRLVMHSGSWRSVRDTWVPTTTGSVWPTTAFTVRGGASVSLGWRRIATSTDGGRPLSQHVGPEGLDVRSYTDAVDATTVYEALKAGTLVGAEAASVRVFFGWGTTSYYSGSVSGGPGTYSDFQGSVTLSYAHWLDGHDTTLFHEYGHAWSMFYAYLHQQDETLSAYLRARGLDGDPRLDTSHAWARKELIAEDYRQLFGTARAAAAPQENTEIPPAAAVAGLREFLAGAFRTGSSQPEPTPTPTPDPTPDPAPATVLAVDPVSVSPGVVRTSGSVTAFVTTAARVDVDIVDSRGNVVRRVTQGAPVQAGEHAWVWDRTTSTGQRAKGGTYTAVVTALSEDGQRAQGKASFAVK